MPYRDKLTLDPFIKLLRMNSYRKVYGQPYGEVNQDKYKTENKHT